MHVIITYCEVSPIWFENEAIKSSAKIRVFKIAGIYSFSAHLILKKSTAYYFIINSKIYLPVK